MVEKGIASGRDYAKELIAKHMIYANGELITKPSTKFDENSTIEVRGEVLPYVSRAGLKLEKALTTFNIDVTDKVCMDIGASTGGFTDCLLKNNAKLVYAVDVGNDQLVSSLRKDSRVIVMENTNIRYLDKSSIDNSIDFITIDVSFISLNHVLPKANDFLSSGGSIVSLIKPQFEAGPENVGKGGIVKHSNIRRAVVKKIIDNCADLGLNVKGLTVSPIKGQKGNIEYLIYVEKSDLHTSKAIDVAYLLKDIEGL